MEILNRNVILIAIKAFNSNANSKPALQKRLYFLGELMKRDFDYRPHFYGPYSDEVDADITLLKTSGLLSEEFVSFNACENEGLEGLQSVYKVTERGQEAIKWLKQELGEAVQEIENAAAIVSSTNKHGSMQSEFNVIELSSAAKAYWIVKRAGNPPIASILEVTLRQLPWALNEKQLRKAVCYLEILGLVENMPSVSICQIEEVSQGSSKPRSRFQTAKKREPRAPSKSSESQLELECEQVF